MLKLVSNLISVAIPTIKLGEGGYMFIKRFRQ